MGADNIGPSWSRLLIPGRLESWRGRPAGVICATTRKESTTDRTSRARRDAIRAEYSAEEAEAESMDTEQAVTPLNTTTAADHWVHSHP